MKNKKEAVTLELRAQFGWIVTASAGLTPELFIFQNFTNQ